MTLPKQVIEENESGFLFSIIYLIKEAEELGFLFTAKALASSLEAFLSDCKQQGLPIKDNKEIISVCLGSMQMHQEERDRLIYQLEKFSNRMH